MAPSFFNSRNTGKIMANKRKKTYVDSHVQGRLIRRIMVHWCIFFFVTCGLFAIMNALGGDPGVSIWERLWGDTSTMVMAGLVILCLFPAFALDTVRFSNRFVGPISRLRSSLRELGETGTTEKIKFRGDDFWTEMADAFNQVIDQVESRSTTEAKDEQATSV